MRTIKYQLSYGGVSYGIKSFIGRPTAPEIVAMSTQYIPTWIANKLANVEVVVEHGGKEWRLEAITS